MEHIFSRIQIVSDDSWVFEYEYGIG
jgi:hypothetical protein